MSAVRYDNWHSRKSMGSKPVMIRHTYEQTLGNIFRKVATLVQNALRN